MPLTPSPSKAGLPRHLDSAQACGLVRGETIAQFELGSMNNFIYLILDWATKRAAIVDPQKDIDTPLHALAAEGFELETCLLTHSHHDHVAGVGPLLERMPGLKIRVHDLDAHRLQKCPPESLEFIRDGEVLKVGAVEIEAIHTPGHSAGEISFHVKDVPGYLLSGDTLFIRDCGRTDLETGDDLQMFTTLQKLKTLPDETVVLPGHHYAREVASLLGDEKRRSPPLLCRNVEELRKLP